MGEGNVTRLSPADASPKGWPRGQAARQPEARPVGCALRAWVHSREATVALYVSIETNTLHSLTFYKQHLLCCEEPMIYTESCKMKTLPSKVALKTQL